MSRRGTFKCATIQICDTHAGATNPKVHQRRKSDSTEDLIDKSSTKCYTFIGWRKAGAGRRRAKRWPIGGSVTVTATSVLSLAAGRDGHAGARQRSSDGGEGEPPRTKIAAPGRSARIPGTGTPAWTIHIPDAAVKTGGRSRPSQAARRRKGQAARPARSGRARAAGVLAAGRSLASAVFLAGYEPQPVNIHKHSYMRRSHAVLDKRFQRRKQKTVNSPEPAF